MKICILTPRFPFPENGGDVLRINNVARYLKAQSHKLILVSFVEEEANIKQAYELYDKVYIIPRHFLTSLFFSAVALLTGRPIQCGYYYSWKFQHQLNNVIQAEEPQLFISHLLRMTPYLNQKEIRSKVIVEMTDALSKTYALAKHDKHLSLKSILYRIEYKRMLRYEKKVAQSFPKTVLVSQHDVDYIKALAPNGNILLHSNGVQIGKKIDNTYNPHKICFVGNMRTLQNQDAALFFAQEVFPLILRKDPDAVFYIVGAEPPKRIQNLSRDKHIVVTSFVDSVEAVIADACVCVAPVRIAAGIQNKILVALAQHVPVVLSSLIAKAIPELENGKNCFIADERNQFARACLQLMQNNQLRADLADAGWNVVNSFYNWHDKLNNYEII